MKRILCLLFVSFILLPAIPLMAQTMTLRTVGTVHILQPGNSPQHVIVLLSGKEGWTGEAAELASRLAQADTLVIGVDYKQYRNAAGEEKYDCPCGDFAHTAEYIEKQRHFKEYVPPVLIGLHDGSVPVYAAITEAPNTFLGAMTLDFQREAGGIRKMCRGDGMRFTRGRGNMDVFLPAPDLKTPWVLYRSQPALKDFVNNTPGARLDPATSGIAEKMRRQIEEWESQRAESMKFAIDLPVIELPSKQEKDPLVIIITGDGGWTSLDHDLGNYLSAQGYAVVGFDLLRYMWSDPSPVQGARDLDRMIRFYCDRWKKQHALLIGYSLGADVLPYLAPQLAPQTVPMLAGVVLIGPSVTSDFSLDISDARQEDLTTGLPLLPMVKEIHAPVLCIGGAVEKESLCRRVSRSEKGLEHMRVELVESGHMFHDNYEEITNLISKNMGVLR